MSADAERVRAETPLETPDVSARVVWMSVAGFLLFTLLSMAALQMFFGARLPREPQPIAEFKAPRLQPDPLRDRRAYDDAQRARLDGARMSLDAAMAAVVARGDKAYDPLDAPVEATP